MSDNNLNFSFNWNNKLDCRCFTTIRLKNERLYPIGKELTVLLKNKPLKTVKIIDVKHFTLPQLNEFMAMLDTGYNLESTIDIFHKMYPQTVNDESVVLSMLLLETIKVLED